jgi:hypothetical protein
LILLRLVLEHKSYTRNANVVRTASDDFEVSACQQSRLQRLLIYVLAVFNLVREAELLLVVSILELE